MSRELGLQKRTVLTRKFEHYSITRIQNLNNGYTEYEVYRWDPQDCASIYAGCYVRKGCNCTTRQCLNDLKKRFADWIMSDPERFSF